MDTRKPQQPGTTAKPQTGTTGMNSPATAPKPSTVTGSPSTSTGTTTTSPSTATPKPPTAPGSTNSPSTAARPATAASAMGSPTSPSTGMSPGKVSAGSLDAGSIGAGSPRHEAPLQPSISDDPAEAARAFASEARDAASSLSADLQETAKAATRAGKAHASAFGSDVGHEMSQVAEEQKVRGVEAMQGFARAINSAASELDRQSPTVARYVRDAAKPVDGFSNNIRGRNVTELMQAATDLAKSQPAVFFAGAMAAGFALSRFLKSSAPDGGNQHQPAAANRYEPGPSQRVPGGPSSMSHRG